MEFVAGAALGLGSGLAPGPLLALVVSTSLQHGTAAGVRVAVAPLVTDAPIILLSILVVGALPSGVVAFLALVGAGVVLHLAVESLRATRSLPGPDPLPGRAGWTALRRGALVNVANPAPWLFWATVGGPVLITTWQQSPPAAVAWLSGFYLALVGAKVGLAVGLGPVRGAASTRAHRVLLLGSGLLLVAVAGLLAAEALAALRWV